MATLETGIKLNDMMSAPIRNILNAMNMMLSTWDDLEDSTSRGLDSDGLEGIRSELNQATIAVQELDSAMEGLGSPSVSAPVSAPVAPVQPEVPLHWETDNLPVFDGDGRFEQEIQSANQMMNTLNDTQRRISTTAQQTDLFPADAVSDLSGMQSRLQAIQNRIKAIEANPMNLNSDTANAELERLRGQLNQAVEDQRDLNNAIDQMDFEGANQAYLRFSRTVSGTEQYIRDNTNAQGAFNNKIDAGARSMDGLSNKIMGAVGAFAGIAGLKKLSGMSDEFTNITARLGMIADGENDVNSLTQKIMVSANNARAKFTDVADTVGKLALNAGDAFKSNDETIQFAENLNKLYAIAGTDASAMAGASLQLTQALGSGVLRGDEFNSVIEAAPNVIATIADYMGVTKGEMRDLAAEGKITADVVKNALISATGQIDEQFQQMPMTWAQVGNEISNALYNASMPLLDLVNMIAQNFDILKPILLGVATAVGIYTAALLIHNTIQGISAMVEGIHAASTMMATGATFAATAAQYGFNAALMACPITWIIIAIVAIIALFYAVVAVINKVKGTAMSATGMICGGINVAVQFVKNLGLTIANIGFGVWGALKAVCSNIGTAFHNVISNVQGWWYGLLSTALDVVAGICEALNKLPFVEFDYSGITSKADEYAAKSAEAKGNKEDYTSIADAFNEGYTHFDTFGDGWVQDAYDAGNEFGKGIDDKVSGFFGGGMEGINPEGFEGMEGLEGNVDDIAGSTGSIADSLDITSEDLKYLRDIAEQEAINRFTTAEVKVDLGGVTNQVNQDTDLDGVIDYLTTGVQEAMERVAEGVHA